MSDLQLISLKLQMGIDPDTNIGKAELMKIWRERVERKTAARLKEKALLERPENPAKAA